MRTAKAKLVEKQGQLNGKAWKRNQRYDCVLMMTPLIIIVSELQLLSEAYNHPSPIGHGWMLVDGRCRPVRNRLSTLPNNINTGFFARKLLGILEMTPPPECLPKLSCCSADQKQVKNKNFYIIFFGGDVTIFIYPPFMSLFVTNFGYSPIPYPGNVIFE